VTGVVCAKAALSDLTSKTGRRKTGSMWGRPRWGRERGKQRSSIAGSVQTAHLESHEPTNQSSKCRGQKSSM